MQDNIILQNRNFISAKRAANIFGYSADYVGQMCREGKLECTMIGRSWYVSEDSVREYSATINNSSINNSSTNFSSTPSQAAAANLSVLPKSRFTKLDLSLVLILFVLSATLISINFISFTKDDFKSMTSAVMNGLVVVPNSGSVADDELIKESIKTNFSDDVSINPDPSGNSGTITPVFKSRESTDYLYVMVPVKEKQKNENK